jgi:hypothetical protein
VPAIFAESKPNYFSNSDQDACLESVLFERKRAGVVSFLNNALGLAVFNSRLRFVVSHFTRLLLAQRVNMSR